MSDFITKEEYEEYFTTDSVKRRDELESKFDNRLDEVLTKVFEACGRKRSSGFWYDNVEYSGLDIDIHEGEYFPYEVGAWGGIPANWLFSDNFIEEIKKDIEKSKKDKELKKQKQKEYLQKRKLVDAELKVYEKQLKQKYGIK